MFTRLSRPWRPACAGAVCGPTPPEHDPVGGIRAADSSSRNMHSAATATDHPCGGGLGRSCAPREVAKARWMRWRRSGRGCESRGRPARMVMARDEADQLGEALKERWL